MRDLPIPGSPTTSTRVTLPAHALASAVRSASISSLRPTSGRFAARSSRDAPRSGGPSDHACTGLALPLTMNGSSSVDTNRVDERSSTDSVA